MSEPTVVVRLPDELVASVRHWSKILSPPPRQPMTTGQALQEAWDLYKINHPEVGAPEMTDQGKGPMEHGIAPRPQGATAGGRRPLLFLDVDGVLNCIGPRQGNYDHHMIGAIPVYVPAGTKERIGRLLEAFEPVWATAWLGSAHRSWRSILALPGEPWPYVSYFGSKLPPILQMAGERRWAWVDDDIDFEFRMLEWTRNMVDGLLISPHHDEGLTDEHVDALLQFAQAEPLAGEAPNPELVNPSEGEGRG